MLLFAASASAEGVAPLEQDASQCEASAQSESSAKAEAAPGAGANPQAAAADHAEDQALQEIDEGSRLINELMAEHAARIVARLQSSGRGRDAAVALMLRPMASTWTPQSLDIGHPQTDEAAADWHTVFDNLDDVPLSLLHALSAPARQFAHDAEWQRYEATLLHRDGGNLSSWLYRVKSLRDDPPQLDAWLRRAAQRVDRFDWLSYEPAILMIDELARLPMDKGLAALVALELEEGYALLTPPDGTDDTTTAAPFSDRELWSIPAFGLFHAVAAPDLQQLSLACSVEEVELRPARRDACLAVIRRALPGSASVLAHSLLTNIWLRLSPGTPEEIEAQHHREISKWLHNQSMFAIASAADHRALLDYMSTPGSSEMGWVRSSMHARGLPPTPPEGWEPTEPEWLQRMIRQTREAQEAQEHDEPRSHR